jgi:hypothetical protein
VEAEAGHFLLLPLPAKYTASTASASSFRFRFHIPAGKYNGCIRALKELIDKPLQWVICLLHANELPLRHVFRTLDGTTKSSDTFSGPIGHCLNGAVSDWPVVEFKVV